MREFGICWGETSKHLLKLLDGVIKRGGGLHYVETGIAEGRTFSAICEHLENSKANWKATGVDIPNGWSLDLKLLTENTEPFGEKVSLNFQGSTVFMANCPSPIDFYLCDSCHEEDCVKIDFLLSEPHITQGGIVAFHDACPKCQGLDIQPHNGRPIGVRNAVSSLGLLDNKRYGWKLVADIQPEDPDERGFIAVQKL